MLRAAPLLLVLLTGCGDVSAEPSPSPSPAPVTPPPAAPPAEAGPDGVAVLTHAAQLEAHDGQTVVLRGTWRQLSLPVKMGGPAKPSKLVAIELQGKASDWDPKAWDGQPMKIRLAGGARPDDELERWRDKQVEVRGTLQLHPPVLDPNVAQPDPEPQLLDAEVVVP